MANHRPIEDYHQKRESGSGCPEANGGSHFFAFSDPNATGRTCIDCGAPEPAEHTLAWQLSQGDTSHGQ